MARKFLLGLFFIPFIAFGLNQEHILQKIVRRAADTSSNTLIVAQDGKILLEKYWGVEPQSKIHLMSITKSVTSLALGKLIDSGVISSTEVQLSRYFPNWKSTLKTSVTLEHVLTHSSCLEPIENPQSLFFSFDHIKEVLGTKLECIPGTKYRYNNVAANLVGALIQYVTGTTVSNYIRDEVFDPMGIDSFRWSTDLSNTPLTMAGLSLNARSLLKIGELMLNKGTFNNTQIVSPEWVTYSTTYSGTSQVLAGRFWWVLYDTQEHSYDDALLNRYLKAGIDKDVVKELRSLIGRRFSEAGIQWKLTQLFGEKKVMKLIQEVDQKGLPYYNIHVGQPIGFSARGLGGQFIVVIPEKRLVAVRQIKPLRVKRPDQTFPDFEDLLKQL